MGFAVAAAGATVLNLHHGSKPSRMTWTCHSCGKENQWVRGCDHCSKCGKHYKAGQQRSRSSGAKKLQQLERENAALKQAAASAAAKPWEASLLLSCPERLLSLWGNLGPIWGVNFGA